MSALGRERAWSDSYGILLEITLGNRRKFPVQILKISTNDPMGGVGTYLQDTVASPDINGNG